MLTLNTQLHLDDATAAELYQFIANPDDASYRRWWPGTHLQLHVLARGRADHVGDVVYMDEYVGRRRLRMRARVIEARPGVRLVWQLARGVRLPARLELELRDDDSGGVEVTHTVRAGFGGAGRILDSAFRLLLSERFARDLDEHVRTEFPKLRDLLRARRSATGASTAASN